MDVNGGFYPNANGSPIFPGTQFTGPLLAGSVIHSDGSGTLAGLGETNIGTSNVGYAQMVQSDVVNSSATTYTSQVVIPAQSQITDIYMMVTTVQAAGTVSVGTTAGGTTALTSGGVSVASLGQINTGLLPTTAGQIALWDNTGTTDIQVTVTFNATGAFKGTLSVFYVQGINNAS
jgi:hypothetical protein